MKKRLDIKCRNKQNPRGHIPRGFCGAGGRTRTGTVSLPVDFESTTSANSITPANQCANVLYNKEVIKSSLFFKNLILWNFF